LAREAGLTHLWCLAKVWNCQRDGTDNRAKHFIDFDFAVQVRKEPPWDIRDLQPRGDATLVKGVIGEVYQDTPEGKFTGKMLIKPDFNVSIGGLIKLTLRNKLTSLLE